MIEIPTNTMQAGNESVNNNVRKRQSFPKDADKIIALEQKIKLLEGRLKKMQHRACHDELTGLPNRSLLKDRFEQAIKQASRQKTAVAILMLDLDCFKCVNDRHGHHIGDALLVEVAQRLVACIRDSDSAYRYGGDEFVILLPHVEPTYGPTELIGMLYTRLARPYFLAEHDLVVTSSIGLAVYPNDGLTQEELIRQADSAMYLTKFDR